MANKKEKHEVYGVYIKFKCPNDIIDRTEESSIEVKLSEYSISSRTQECEICGSHGDVTIEYKCPICGETHKYELSSW
jgi:hypothetical protein